MPKIYKTCVQCEHDFYVSEKDQDFFASRELEFPKRCWSCRQQNRKEKAAHQEARAEAITDAAASNPGVSADRVQEDWDTRPQYSAAAPRPENGGAVEFFKTEDESHWSDKHNTETKPSNTRRKKRRHRG